MKARFTRLPVLLFPLLFILSSPATAQPRKLAERELRLISEMMDHYDRLDLFSGVVLLASEGKIVFNKAYGFSDRENKVRNTTETEFRLASVSKLMTIVAVLRLVDEGKLDLDDNVGKYLGGFSDEISKTVTVRHLITMTSGLGDYLRDWEFQKNPEAFRTVNDCLRVIRKEKLSFEPGSRERYSNSGFVLLGGIIEMVTGKDYFEYINELIILPSRMEHTSFAGYSAGGNEAIGYHRNLDGEYKKVLSTIPAGPAGNALSSASDLLKYSLKVCTTNDLLSDHAKLLFYSDYDSTYHGDWAVLKSNLKKVFGWTGARDGVSTMVRHYLGDESTIIILSNYSNIGNEVWDNIKMIITGGMNRDVQIPLVESIYRVFKEKGAGAVKHDITVLTKNSVPGQTTIPPATILNDLGSKLIEERKYPEAIEILSLNTELFPADASTYDGLAEVYMLAGNRDRAITNYEKSLQLDPENTNAMDRVRVLRAMK